MGEIRLLVHYGVDTLREYVRPEEKVFGPASDLMSGLGKAKDVDGSGGKNEPGWPRLRNLYTDSLMDQQSHKKIGKIWEESWAVVLGETLGGRSDGMAPE